MAQVSDVAPSTTASAQDFFELLAQFRALSLYYQEIHWTNQSNLFYEDHLLAERLYNDVNDQIDEIAEKGIGATNDRSFPLVIPQLARVAEILQPYPHVGDATELFGGALQFEMALGSLLDEMFVRIRSAGVNDLIGQLADSGLQRIYLLQSQIGPTTAPPSPDVTAPMTVQARLAQAMDAELRKARK